MKIGKRSEQAAQLSTDIDWGLIAAFWVGCRIIEKAPQKWKIEPKALELAKQIAAERAALLKRRQRRSPFPFCRKRRPPSMIRNRSQVQLPPPKCTIPG